MLPVERYGAIMFVSFSVGNTGPFKDITGITTVAENLKKEFLAENTFEVLGKNYNKIIRDNEFVYPYRLLKYMLRR